MITFKDFVSLCEATYDKEVMSGSQIRTMGTGGRVSAERKKSEAELRRTRRGPGGTTLPARPYKPRKDIGTQRAASTRVQAPTQERGAADVKAKAAAAAKEERRKAALARIAAKKKGEAAPETKPKGKELEKQASKLLTTKKAKGEPKGEKIERTTKHEYTRDEKKKMVRAGKRLHKDIIKGRDLPASHYQP